ncbi:exonuclease domain-containing protein [Nocardia sp. NPDC050718]|uniref:exonuclease domain-containing protein n=1 Tax=Nocardia sp. NPDC050718 TaxID=3155788 RepID=UPI0033C9125D
MDTSCGTGEVEFDCNISELGYDAMLMQGMTQVGAHQQAAGFGEFTVVDVETSGLQPSRHRVLSVAALTLDSAGQVTREFHTLLDPECDPGPVHVHGLTAEVLRGSPRFAHVREQLSSLMAGRVLVAHNALFDFGFLASEFDRAGGVLPVRRRLCTLALARRVAVPTPDYKLATLAGYYGVPQQKAHDALDDTRVLVNVLRALVADAARLGIAPPLLSCEPTAGDRAATTWPLGRSGPKPPCAYAYPGRWEPGAPLRQGMKVAFTGDTWIDREELVTRAEAAGLDVTGAVSGRTSVLVTNAPDSGTGKARKAIQHATPIMDEPRFVALLATIEPGQPRTTTADQPPSRRQMSRLHIRQSISIGSWANGGRKPKPTRRRHSVPEIPPPAVGCTAMGQRKKPPQYLVSTSYHLHWQGTGGIAVEGRTFASEPEAMALAREKIKEMRDGGAATAVRSVTVKLWNTEIRNPPLFEASYYDDEQELTTAETYAARVHEEHWMFDRGGGHVHLGRPLTYSYPEWEESIGPKVEVCPHCGRGLSQDLQWKSVERQLRRRANF